MKAILSKPHSIRQAGWIVRINDRGPFVGGRDLEVARGEAAAIGMIEQDTATNGLYNAA